MESESKLTPREKYPLQETARRFKYVTLHHAGQRATHYRLSYSGPIYLSTDNCIGTGYSADIAVN